MQKNVAGQTWTVFAFNRTTNVPVTGDAANITAQIKVGAAALAATNDTNPTEEAGGYYTFTLQQGETNADELVLIPASGTADVQVIGVPGRVDTVPAGFPDQVFLDAAAVKTQVDQALVDIHLDALLAIDYDPASPPGNAGALLNELTEDDGGGNIRYTVKALENGPGGAGGVVQGQWRWLDEITATDPTSGYIKGNNATLASITEVYVSELSETLFNTAAIIGQLKAGDTLLLSRANNGQFFWIFDVDAPPVDNGTWWTITGTMRDSNGPIGNNSLCDVGFLFAQPAPITDWAANEREQIREALGIDGNKTAATGGQLQNKTEPGDAMQLDANGQTQVENSVWNAARNAHTTAGTFGEHTGDEAMRGTDGANTQTPLDQAGTRTAVWDAPRASHQGAGSFGEHTGDSAMRGTDGANTQVPLDQAGTRTAVWDAPRTSHQAAGSFGEHTGDSAMRGTDGAATPGAAMDLITDAVDADAVAASGAEEITDTLLDRDLSAGPDTGSESKRTPRQAMRAQRNRWNIAGTLLTVYKENDATVSHTAQVTSDAAADPLTEVNPADA